LSLRALSGVLSKISGIFRIKIHTHGLK